jgi:hypothetical protein
MKRPWCSTAQSKLKKKSYYGQARSLPKRSTRALRELRGSDSRTHACRVEHHPQLCKYATFMLSGFVSDIDNTNRRGVVLKCRLFRRGEGWATRQERLDHSPSCQGECAATIKRTSTVMMGERAREREKREI